MSDVEAVLSAFPRVLHACRQRHVVDGEAGRRVSAHQAEILGHLHPTDPTMVTELAEHLGVTPSTMSLTLKRLEAGGYVSRERDPADRRVTNVRLTDAGERVRDARTILDPERVARMLDALDPAARAEALRGLVVLAKAADALVWRGRESVAGQTSGER